ncbi:MAG: hypothetical protein KAG61_05780 [Bacteriovoracaceae bacterium]|nr:hypothetical protein [Bacteriovoracaceae bacterium]
MFFKKEVDILEREEDEVRSRVNSLSDDARRDFFCKLDDQIKDPDTYATLNYFFIAGLHHFYLKKFTRGSIDLFLYALGLALLSTEIYSGGLILLLLVSIFEIPSLFKSEVIVKRYNLELRKEILSSLRSL